MIRQSSIVIAACLCLIGGFARAETFRCGSWIASPEMTVDELQEKCGKPAKQTSETIDVYGPSAAGGGRVKRGTSKIEKWTYDRGNLAAPIVVTIVDGKIKSMERAE
jgi:hypothetical protein